MQRTVCPPLRTFKISPRNLSLPAPLLLPLPMSLHLRVLRVERLKGPDDAIRDRAAAVLASLPLCSEGDAWTLAAGKVTLEAHRCVLLSLYPRLLGETCAFGTFST